MSFYYVYQHNPKDSKFEKPLHASSGYSSYEDAKRNKQIHKADDLECIFSEIIEADSAEDVLKKVDPKWLNRI